MKQDQNKFFHSSSFLDCYKKDCKTILESFLEEFRKSNYVKISTGYVSQSSLKKLDQLLVNSNKKVCIILGMYYFEGIARSLYELLMQLNEKWKSQNIGEIRLITARRYHGKLYCFYKDNKCFKAMIGSANLSFIPLEDEQPLQNEIALFTEDPVVMKDMSEHLDELNSDKISQNISHISPRQLNFIEERDNKETTEEALELDIVDTDFLTKISNLSLNSKIVFYLPLKAPSEKEKYINSRANYTKSNLNVCYGIPRGGKEKEKSWYEMQITVSKKIVKKRNYPKTRKRNWFYVITDDGYQFKAHTTSQNKKQFSAVGDEKLLGKWIKGRLVKAGLVQPVRNVSLDIEKRGMITKEILKRYGCETLTLVKTGESKRDEKGTPRDIWFLSFSKKIVN